MSRLMSFLRQVRGDDQRTPARITTPEVRQAVQRRLEEQKVILAALDADIDAKRLRRTPR